MGTACTAAAGPRTVAGHDGQGRTLVRGGGALVGSGRRLVVRPARRAFWPLAQGVRPFLALAPSRREAAGAGPAPKRDSLAPAHGRTHRRAGAPSGGGRERKDSPVGYAFGHSWGGFTTKLHLSCDARGRICALALTGGQAVLVDRA